MTTFSSILSVALYKSPMTKSYRGSPRMLNGDYAGFGISTTWGKSVPNEHLVLYKVRQLSRNSGWKRTKRSMMESCCDMGAPVGTYRSPSGRRLHSLPDSPSAQPITTSRTMHRSWSRDVLKKGGCLKKLFISCRSNSDIHVHALLTLDTISAGALPR